MYLKISIMTDSNKEWILKEIGFNFTNSFCNILNKINVNIYKTTTHHLKSQIREISEKEIESVLSKIPLEDDVNE